MKKIQTLLLKASAYTVLILALFYLFASSTGYVNAAITFPTYALILGFGTIISIVGLVFESDKFKTPVKFVMHFATLFLAFLIIFVISGNISTQGEGAIFSAIVIFAFFYIIVCLLVYATRRILSVADRKIDEKNKKKEAEKQKKKTPYKPIYAKEDRDENN